MPEPKPEPKPVCTISAILNSARDGWQVFHFVATEIVAEYDLKPGQRDWPRPAVELDAIVRDEIWDMIHGQANPDQPWRIVDDIANTDLSHTIGEALPA